MRIKLLIFVVIISIIGCATSEEFIRPGTNFKKYKRIAVLPLTDFPTLKGSGIQVADIISMSLISSDFIIIDRSQTEKIVSEQGLSLSGIIVQETAPEVGRMLGVQAILTGSINEWQTTSANVQLIQGGAPAMVYISSAGITLKLIDCETGQIIWAGSARGSTYGINLESMAAKKAIDNILRRLNSHMR